MTGHVWVGVCGWDYRHWQGRFYPAGLAHRDRLQFVAARLNAAEIDATFYSLRKPADFGRWRQAVPAGFVFAVKGSRYLTHMKRLLDPEIALANFFASGPLALGTSLGPFLWQLPPDLRFDPDRIALFLATLPRTTGELAELAARHDPRIVADPCVDPGENRPVRHVLEPRHDSFADPAAVGLLEHHGVALALAHSAGRWPAFDRHTTDFRYLRLHGTEPGYRGSYRGQWQPWLETIQSATAAGSDVYVFFDNDADSAAPRDAEELSARLTVTC